MRFLLERFLNMKLRAKFLLSYTFLILLTVAMIGTVTYTIAVNSIQERITDFSSYLIEQIANNLEKRTKDVELFAFNHFRNSEVAGLLLEGSETGAFNALEEKIILSFLNEYLTEKPYIHSAMLISPPKSGDSEPYKNYVERYGFLEKDLLARLDMNRVLDNWGRAVWVPGNGGLVYMQKALYDVKSTKFLGIIVLGIEKEYITEIYDSIDTLRSGDIYIVNEQNELLIPHESANGFDPAFIAGKLKEGFFETHGSFSSGGGKYISTINSISNDKWKVLHIISVKELTKDTEAIQYWTLTTSFVALLIAFLIAAFLSNNITENIRLLLQSMKQFSVDFTHKAIVPKGRDEVGLLAEKFNFMAEKINELILTVYEEKLQKQKAEYRTLQFEYKALQAQMNPHFLYNTLESIHSLAMLKGEREIAELIYLLGSLLRESIRKKGDLIRLSEEIDYIQRYLSIHKLIYGDRIEVRYDLDDSLMDIRVPRFILQPIVENAIIHGIEAKPGKGVIHIRCFKNQDDLVMEVCDNGVGMDEMTVRNLLNPEADPNANPDDKHTKVGVISVSKRIHLLFGKTYGLAIDSRPNDGTTIRIRLPIGMEGGL